MRSIQRKGGEPGHLYTIARCQSVNATNELIKTVIENVKNNKKKQQVRSKPTHETFLSHWLRYALLHYNIRILRIEVTSKTIRLEEYHFKALDSCRSCVNVIQAKCQAH